MSNELKHPVEIELSEHHLVLLETIARKTRSSVSDIARELLEDYLTNNVMEEEVTL